jgi:Rod binding domain-containing protein
MTISGSMDFLTPTPDAKAAHAAKDFEGLLLEQILKCSDDEEDNPAIGFGEDQLAMALAASGGIGLAKTVEAGLSSRQASASVVSSLPVSSSGAST